MCVLDCIGFFFLELQMVISNLLNEKIPRVSLLNSSWILWKFNRIRNWWILRREILHHFLKIAYYSCFASKKHSSLDSRISTGWLKCSYGDFLVTGNTLFQLCNRWLLCSTRTTSKRKSSVTYSSHKGRGLNSLPSILTFIHRDFLPG